MSTDSPVCAQSVPRFGRGVRLNFSAARKEWILLAPERMFKLDAVSKEILERVDGERSIAMIVESLAGAFDASPAQIETDVITFIGQLVDRRMLEL